MRTIVVTRAEAVVLLEVLPYWLLGGTRLLERGGACVRLDDEALEDLEALSRDLGEASRLLWGPTSKLG